MSPPFKTHDVLSDPGISHGFFGRQGGVSKRAYASLNAGLGSDDNFDDIKTNRARIAAAIGAKPEHLLSLSQVHSSRVLTIDRAFDGAPPQADGMVTAHEGLALSVLSADCGPVLFCDPKARIIGACHAGWRGALAGVTTQTIIAMENLGAERDNIRAVLGPCISQENYEVGHDFRDDFVAENEAHDRFFKRGSSGRPHFDLSRFILAQLRGHGVTRIASVNTCTYGDPAAYFSYRYNTHQGVSGYGRNISVIMLSQ